MLQCEGLCKRFGDVEAVKGVSMKVDPGTCIGLLGPNGAGKTTMMAMMTGLLRPDSGQVLFDGQVMDRGAVKVKREIGIASQHINLDKELTVEENMEFAGRLYQMDKREIISRSQLLLEFLGLSEAGKRMAQNLSGGMKRKLMIGKALIHDPRYLFLDEPTVGIDPNARRDIWEFLEHQKRSGKTILLTTHYIEEASRLCDRVLLMDQGAVFKEGTPQELTREIGDYKVEYETVYGKESRFFKTLSQAKEWAKEVQGTCSILPSTLEDVFFQYTNKGVAPWR